MSWPILSESLYAAAADNAACDASDVVSMACGRWGGDVPAARRVLHGTAANAWCAGRRRLTTAQLRQSARTVA